MPRPCKWQVTCVQEIPGNDLFSLKGTFKFWQPCNLDESCTAGERVDCKVCLMLVIEFNTSSAAGSVCQNYCSSCILEWQHWAEFYTIGYLYILAHYRHLNQHSGWEGKNEVKKLKTWQRNKWFNLNSTQKILHFGYMHDLQRMTNWQFHGKGNLL